MAADAVGADSGRAVPLFTVSPDGGVLQLQEDTLEQVLLTDELRDSLVIPVTITGAFRRGKSFLLNVLLRYLQSEAGGGEGDWLAAEDAPLTGFPWRGGRHAHTRGLQLWSRPLPITLADGRTAHVLLIDSQGAFDDVSTPTESVAVRALAGLLSAVQVLNVSRQPQSDDLQQTRLCAEYGRLLASAAGSPTSAQRLVLLVRDWAFPEDQPFGADGGQRVLASWLAGGDIEDVGDGRDGGDGGHGGDGVDGGDGGAAVAASSGLAVEELECFLLPYPGAEAAGGGPQFSGAVSQLSEEFADQLRRLVPWLLDAKRLPLRHVDGQPLTGASLAALCSSLAAYTADPPPALQAAADQLTATAAQRAREAALQTYSARLQSATASEEPVSEAELQATHQEAEGEARRVLASYPGVNHFSEEETVRSLTAAIQEQWERVSQLNVQHQQLRAARADSQNATLTEAARNMYEAAMQRALPANGPSVSDACLRERHAAAVCTALQHFDSCRDMAGPSAAQQRSTLQQQLESQLTAHLARNGVLRQQEAAAAAQLAAERTQRAVEQAQAQYEQQMSAAGELTEPALRQAHQAAAAAAQATAGAAGEAQLSGWLAARLEHRLQEAWQREKQELELQQAQAQAQLLAAQQAQAQAGNRRRRRGCLKIGGAKVRLW